MQRAPPQTSPPVVVESVARAGRMTKWERWTKLWRKRWFVEVWTEYRELFKAFVADFVFSGLLGGGLELFHLWATKSSAIETQAVVRVHYYGTVGVVAIFGVSFAIDIIVFQYK